ncbi:MAG TPA: NAD(P)H-hydrate dehydratase [Gemmatimonadaceae bacterium]|nr:NAD(P)H-hydrate dehydratase [Gemmatimonadaceae bacterium]
MSARSRDTAITRALLKRIPLPQPDDEGDKDDRGQVLVVGGSAQVAGAVLLAGVAALRAGAGKLQLATVASAAAALGMAVPEALVVGLPQTRTGEIAGSRAHPLLAEYAAETSALLVGPGMSSERAAHALIAPLVKRLSEQATLVLDAAGILALRIEESMLHPLEGRAVLTPHAGEMASLLGVDKRDVEEDPREAARDAASRFGAVVALKGAESWIAEPDGTLYRYAGGTVGLATSGSGDTLAGIIVGLAARGAPAVHAAMWGAFVHGAAGRLLSRRVGPIGFLARELLAELPPILARLR